jgi:ligand-binding SRPBCC domain-containing protein
VSDVRILEREQRLPGTPEEVFPFFADPRNLERITPALLRFRVLGDGRIAIAQGTLIRYRLRFRGVPVNWLTEIVDWSPPHRFADVQARGPFALWHHTHSFERDGDATVMRDRVVYRIGFGPLGALAHALVVRRDLERIFDFRAERVPALLAADAARAEPAEAAGD